MSKIFSNIFFFFLLGTFFVSCKKAPNKGAQSTSATSRIEFKLLDSTAAAVAINTDKIENFFDRVEDLEMSVLMKKSVTESSGRAEILKDFKDAQRAEVSSFAPSEREILARVGDSINVYLSNLSPQIKIPTITLIKLKGDLYGKSTFFTRQEGIFIPGAEIHEENIKAIESVFLHEIFHIISRYNPDIRKKCYELIGFYPLDKIPTFPENLQERLLHNPDGLNFEYGITLNWLKKEPIIAIPMIYVNSPDFTEEKPEYFSYLQFDLFRVVEEAGEMKVVSEDPVGPEIPDNYYQSFFDQIKDNTQYIIHPDEIMADNFMLATFEKTGQSDLNLSNEGMELVQKLQAIVFQ